jgi:hypothetical protein
MAKGNEGSRLQAALLVWLASRSGRKGEEIIWRGANNKEVVMEAPDM